MLEAEKGTHKVSRHSKHDLLFPKKYTKLKWIRDGAFSYWSTNNQNILLNFLFQKLKEKLFC
jgi:hypothetical protein